MKNLFIAYGVNNRYIVGDTQKENPKEDKPFNSYTDLMAYFGGNTPEAKRLRTREVQVIATGVSDDQMRCLEKDLLTVGFKKLTGVIRK